MSQGTGSPALAMGLPIVASTVDTASLAHTQFARGSPASGSSAKRKRPLRSKPSKGEESSAFTTQLQNGIDTVDFPDSPDHDKKRNKLGYQRKAVACGKLFFASIGSFSFEFDLESHRAAVTLLTK